MWLNMAIIYACLYICITYTGFMGSLVSFQWSPGDTGPQHNGDSLFGNSQKRQLFTQTGV